MTAAPELARPDLEPPGARRGAVVYPSAAAAASPCPSLAGAHLTVSGPARFIDRDLQDIFDRIDDEVLVDEEPGLLQLLETLATCDGAQARTLDLVGHSTGNQGLLTIGHWTIRAGDPFFADPQVKVAMVGSGVTQIRLIGCCTAMTRDGQAAIASIAKGTGIPTRGTTAVIAGRHFLATGFDDVTYAAVLSAGDAAVAPRPVVHLDAPLAKMTPLPGARLADLPIAATDRAHPSAATFVVDLPAHPQFLRALLALIDAPLHADPGLLTVPTASIFLPETGGTVRAAHVLFDWQLLRIEPRTATGPRLMGRIKDPAAFRALVAPFARC